MTIRVGWEGGSCGVQTFHDPGAVDRARQSYPEIFGRLFRRPDDEDAIRDMTARATEVNEIAMGSDVEFVFEVEPSGAS